MSAAAGSHTVTDGRVPVRRRGPSRLISLLVVFAALLGAAFATAAPASAAENEVTYGVNNGTSQTLTFVSAHGPGTRCSAREFRLKQCTTVGDESFRVSPKEVLPRYSFVARSELNPFNKEERNTFRVTYRIGDSNDTVVLHVSKELVACTVHGTQDYTCNRTGTTGRSFVLVPRV